MLYTYKNKRTFMQIWRDIFYFNCKYILIYKTGIGHFMRRGQRIRTVYIHVQQISGRKCSHVHLSGRKLATYSLTINSGKGACAPHRHSLGASHFAQKCVCKLMARFCAFSFVFSLWRLVTMMRRIFSMQYGDRAINHKWCVLWHFYYDFIFYA